MTILRRILREPAFNGHPVFMYLADTSMGTEGVGLIQVSLYGSSRNPSA